MIAVDLPGYPDMVIRWVLALAGFLVLSAVFRDRFSIEGAVGYLWVLILVVPVNVVAPFYFAEILILPAPPMAEIWLDMLLVNTALIYGLSKFLPGLVTEGHSGPLVFCALVALIALGLYIMPEIPVLPKHDL